MSKSFNIYELLDKIRSRPAMYVGGYSITRLDAFLQGYWSAVRDYEIPFDETLSFRGFYDWVAMRVGYYESTSGWANMLLETENGDEEKALEKFFLFLDEFKQKKARVIYQVKLPLASTSKVWRTHLIDGQEIPEPPPTLVQIIKYTDDKGVFIRYIDKGGEIIEEEYMQDLNLAFRMTKMLSLRIEKSDLERISE